MNPTAGSSIFSFVLRVVGTIVAFLAALCVLYIPDQQTPGILVFLWIFVSLGLYVPLKQPQFTVLALIG